MALAEHPAVAAYRASAQALLPKERVPATAVAWVLSCVNRADRAMAAGDIPAAHEPLVMAQQVLDLLRGALDPQVGGALATRLDAVYGFLSTELAQANLEKNRARLEQARRILQPLIEAWEAAAQAVLLGGPAPSEGGTGG